MTTLVEPRLPLTSPITGPTYFMRNDVGGVNMRVQTLVNYEVNLNRRLNDLFRVISYKLDGLNTNSSVAPQPALFSVARSGLFWMSV
jgi:hypothetical protein